MSTLYQCNRCSTQVYKMPSSWVQAAVKRANQYDFQAKTLHYCDTCGPIVLGRMLEEPPVLGTTDPSEQPRTMFQKLLGTGIRR